MSLKAGIAKIDISPRKPMFLVGYPHVERISTGIHDPLMASALYLENGDNALIMIALDILFLDAGTICEIRRKIAAKSMIKAENIMISCTHTHSGPLTIDMLAFRNDPVVPGLDTEYMNFLIEGATTAGLKAVEDAKPAEIAVTSVNVEGVGCNRHDPDGPRDSEAGILVIRDSASKKLKAVSIVYCMHPTVLHEDSTLVSADFPGYTRNYIKSSMGEDITVLYHTGPEGNQSPRYHVKGQTFQEAERLGNLLGKYIIKKISALSDADFYSNPAIAVASGNITPERRQFPSVCEAEKNLDYRRKEFERLKAERASHGLTRTAECSVFGAEETLFLAKCAEEGSLNRFLESYRNFEVQVMRIGRVYLVNFAGEMFVEYSLNLKKMFYEKLNNAEKLFVVCLANGETQGYIVTEDAQGYEADNSIFTPKTGQIMMAEALRLIEKLAME